MILNVILLLCIVSILGLLFVFSGQYILFKAIKEINMLSAELITSLSYFTGMTFFLFILRILTFVLSSMYFSVIIAFLSILILSVIVLNKKTMKNSSILLLSGLIKKTSFWILLISIALIQFMYWTVPDSLSYNTVAHLGSLHSPRYVNIASYIFETNTIPVINQNYGQSLLTTVPLFCGIKAPYFTLFLWLAQSMFFLILITFGVLKWLGLEYKKAIWGTMIVLCGNTAFSLTHILCIDSGSPFLFNGYTDTIASIGTFIVFFFWLNSVLADKHKINLIYSLPLLILLGFTWNIFAPQNIIFASGILFYCSSKKIFVNSKNNSRIKFATILFIAASLIGALMGGMLTPKKLIDNIKVEGLKQISSVSNSKIGFLPQLPYHYFDGNNWVGAKASLGEAESLKEYQEQYRQKNFSNILVKMAFKVWWVVETNIWIAIRIMMFPVIGIVGLWILLLYKSKYKDGGQNKELYKRFLSVNTLIFIPGLIIAFFFTLSVYKWELTRFLIPGIYMAMCSFSILIYKINWGLAYTKSKLIPTIITFFVIAPPLIQSIIFISINLYDLDLFLDVTKLILGNK